MFSCKEFNISFYIAWSYISKTTTFISRIRSLVESAFLKKMIQKTGLNVVVCILNFIVRTQLLQDCTTAHSSLLVC